MTTDTIFTEKLASFFVGEFHSVAYMFGVLICSRRYLRLCDVSSTRTSHTTYTDGSLELLFRLYGTTVGQSLWYFSVYSSDSTWTLAFVRSTLWNSQLLIMTHIVQVLALLHVLRLPFVRMLKLTRLQIHRYGAYDHNVLRRILHVTWVFQPFKDA